jgi:hypothetical protein
VDDCKPLVGGSVGSSVDHPDTPSPSGPLDRDDSPRGGGGGGGEKGDTASSPPVILTTDDVTATAGAYHMFTLVHLSRIISPVFEASLLPLKQRPRYSSQVKASSQAYKCEHGVSPLSMPPSAAPPDAHFASSAGAVQVAVEVESS